MKIKGDLRTVGSGSARGLILEIILVLAACFSMAAGPAGDNDPNLKRLLEGNQRFVAGSPKHGNQSAARRAELLKGQAPFAVILTCSDSRVAPELIFDQGLGDLFVIRVAGNVLDNLGLGSIEYAVEHLRAPLLVVLGHSNCGAVAATVGGGHAPGHIHCVVNALEPAVTATRTQAGNIVDNAVRANVQAVVKQLQSAEPILRETIQAGKLKVAGARYDLESGAVEILP